MSGNLCHLGGGEGVGRLMANAILNFHFDYLNTSLIVVFFQISVMLNFSSRKFPDLTGCFPDTLKRAGSVPPLLVDRVPFFGDNLSVGFLGVKSDNRNPGDVNKVNVSLLFFHQIYCQIKREWF